MLVQTPAEFIALNDRILKGMLDYMDPSEAEDDFAPGYTKNHVERCRSILQNYLASVFQPSVNGSAEIIMDAVKVAVLSLNELNNACDGSLIETDQREDICDLIISSAAHAGLASEEDDITEAWRDW